MPLSGCWFPSKVWRFLIWGSSRGWKLTFCHCWSQDPLTESGLRQTPQTLWCRCPMYCLLTSGLPALAWGHLLSWGRVGYTAIRNCTYCCPEGWKESVRPHSTALVLGLSFPCFLGAGPGQLPALLHPVTFVLGSSVLFLSQPVLSICSVDGILSYCK